MSDVLLDKDGHVIEDDDIQFATLEDLCQSPKPKTVVVPTGNGPMKIMYMPFLSISKLGEIQDRHKPRRKGDKINQGAFMVDIISEIMISPKIKTAADMEAFRKGASGALVLNLVNEVVDTESFEEIRKELGEA